MYGIFFSRNSLNPFPFTNIDHFTTLFYFPPQTTDLREQIAQLTAHRDSLQTDLNETTEDVCRSFPFPPPIPPQKNTPFFQLLNTRERLRVKSNECAQMYISAEEAELRGELTQEFHWGAFRLQAESVLAATAQTYGGRVLSSLHGWDTNGGVLWRDLYLWPDVATKRLNYAHRDRRWGEVESIDLSRVTSIEVESFYEYPGPPQIERFRHLGFYIEMVSGEKHRFCATHSVERSEWLDSLRQLLLAVCYDSPQRKYHTVVGGGVPVPPRPAQQGAASWAAVEGGGSPRAAAAVMLKPGSPRRARTVVTQPSSDVPGTFGHASPTRAERERESASPHRVTVTPNTASTFARYGAVG